MVSIPEQSTITQALAIAGLSLVPLCSYYFRIYSQTLDFAQMLYAFWIAFASQQIVASRFVDYSWIKFMPSFLDKAVDCEDTKYTYICSYGNLVSPLIAWLGVAFLMLIIIKIISCKKPNVRYQGFYNFWKGFFRWWSAPLVYSSTNTVINELQKDSDVQIKQNLYSAGIILAFIFLWILIELIGYKCTQREQQNTWKKWIEYFSHWRVISVMVICNLSVQIDILAKYFIYGAFVIYEIFYLVKYKFTFKCCERFFFILQEAVIIAVFSIFIFNSNMIAENDLDLIGLFIVFVLQILLFLPKLCKYCKSDGEDEEERGAEVNPEQNERGKLKKSNSFMDAQMLGQNSNDNIRSPVGSRSPPRRGRR